MAKSQTGFSLIELLVVLTIIALLGAVVGPQVMKHLGQRKSGYHPVADWRPRRGAGPVLSRQRPLSGFTNDGLSALMSCLRRAQSAMERSLPEEEKDPP